MDFLYIKSLHIIFVVCWFAALFYMVRLFIYTAEAQKKDDPEKKYSYHTAAHHAEKTLVHHRLAGYDRHFYFWLVDGMGKRHLFVSAVDVA